MPRSAATFNQLGWVWATCPDPDIRNGERARECATRACELTEWTEPGFLDTLAAACAECGLAWERDHWFSGLHRRLKLGGIVAELRRV